MSMGRITMGTRAGQGPFESSESSPRRLEGNTPISRLMTTSADMIALHDGSRRAPSLDALSTVREATHFMVERGVRQIQVRNHEGEIVGVLAASDLYRWVTDGDDGAEARA